MILHPEILRNLRGNRVARKLWQDFSTYYEISKKYSYEESKPRAIDAVGYDFYNFVSKYAELMGSVYDDKAEAIYGTMGRLKLMHQCHQSPCYKFNNDFLSNLKNVDVDVNPSFLKNEDSGYVVLDESFLKENYTDETINRLSGFYYWVCTVKNPNNGEDMVCIQFMPTLRTELNASSDFKWGGDFDITEDWKIDMLALHMLIESSRLNTIAIDKRMSIQNAMELAIDVGLKYQNKTIGTNKSTTYRHSYDEPIARLVANCVAYINSQQPDLQNSVPGGKSAKKRKDELIKKGIHVNEFSIPVTFVSWSYKKPTIYNVDSAIVSGHFRWQPCGAQFSEVKLIWIDEHERHYNNEKGKEDDRIRL